MLAAIVPLPRQPASRRDADPAMALRRRVRDNIRELAGARGWSLQMVADRAGVSRSQLFNVLGCRASPRLDWLAKVADVFEVDVCRLLAPRPEPRRPRPR